MHYIFINLIACKPLVLRIKKLNKAIVITLVFGKQFDLVMADPPYLDENCLTKTSVSIKYISKKENTKVVLCTGAVMEDLARRCAHFHRNRPQFINGFHVCQKTGHRNQNEV